MKNMGELFTVFYSDIRGGMAHLTVTTKWAAEASFSSMKFPLCFHLQTGSGGHPVPSPVSTLQGCEAVTYLSPMPRLKMSGVFKIPVS